MCETDSSVCLICVDTPAIIFCKDGHGLCTSDLNEYMVANVLPHAYKLSKDQCRVRCPSVGCQHSYEVLELWVHLAPLQRLRYADLMHKIVETSARFESDDTNTKGSKSNSSGLDIQRSCADVMELLTLKCGSCFQPVDPTPDGCSAVKCLNCGLHYCAYCMQSGFDKNDEKYDSSLCHEHVSTHHPSTEREERNAFLSNDILKKGQLELLYKLLVEFLHGFVSSNDGALHNAELATLICRRELDDLGLTVEELWIRVHKARNVSNLSSTTVEAADKDSCVHSSDIIHEKQNRKEVNQVNDDIQHVEKYGGAPIANALLTANTTAVKQILSSISKDKLDVNYLETVHGHTILNLAIVTGNVCVATKLIELGADVLKQSTSTRNAIYLAIECGHWEIADLILSKYPRIHVDDPCTDEVGKYSPLHVACRFGHIDAFRGLLSRGADIEKLEMEFHFTPLALAAVMKQEHICLEALSCGCKLGESGYSKSNRHVLYIIVEKGLSEALQLVLDRVEFSEHENKHWNLNSIVSKLDGSCLLHVCAAFNQIHLLRILLNDSRITHLETRDNNGYTPLRQAIWLKKEAAALYLLQKGAISDEDGTNLSMKLAITSNLPSVVRALLAGKCGQKLYDYLSKSYDLPNKKYDMLTYAVRTECIECIQALLEAAGLGSFDLFAVLSETQNCDIITLLLEKGPDMVEMLFAPKDRRPGDFNGNSKLATLLRANICKTAYVKLLLTSSSRIDIGMRVTIRTQPQIVQCNLLHLAASTNSSSTCSMLLRLSPGLIHERDSLGLLAVDIAQQKGCVDALRVLV
jgi:ankyrin repeat protein